MKHLSYIALLLLSLVVPASAQEPDTTYSLILSTGAGFTKNISVFNTVPDGLNRSGFSGTVRVMWKPEHLLSVGFESGITHVYTVEAYGLQTSYGETNAKGTLNAIPLLFTLSMPLWEDFNIYGGIGYYVLYSDLESFGNTTTANSLSTGFSTALSYSRPISENMRLGTEVRWLYMSKFQDNNLTLHLMLYYTFLKY